MCCQLRIKEQIASQGIQMEPTEQVETHHRPTTILTNDLLGDYT